MDVREEIANRIGQLTPELQERVLGFVAAISRSSSVGEKGSNVRQFSSSLDSLSAEQMIQAIEDECERVEW